MSDSRTHAVGKRKNSVARVWIKEGKGEFLVNKRKLDDYFIRPTSRMMAVQTLELLGLIGKWDVSVNVHGGGLMGQAGAIRHGITKCFLEIDETHRSVLKKAGLVTRDARIKERKKYGQKGARARFQFSKR